MFHKLIRLIHSSDRTAIVLSAACLVHCVAGPLILAVAGFAGLIGTSEKLEPVFLGGLLILGLANLIPGYRHRHGRISCMLLFGFGIATLALRHHVPLNSERTEAIMTAVGAGLIAGAHTLNLRKGRSCECCEAGATESESREHSGPASCSQ
jgi:hypothetical protein